MIVLASPEPWLMNSRAVACALRRSTSCESAVLLVKGLRKGPRGAFGARNVSRGHELLPFLQLPRQRPQPPGLGSLDLYRFIIIVIIIIIIIILIDNININMNSDIYMT